MHSLPFVHSIPIPSPLLSFIHFTEILLSIFTLSPLFVCPIAAVPYSHSPLH
jgi:hypothetical protein